VKGIEFHPTESLVAVALLNGTVVVFDAKDLSIVRTICVDPQMPIRCVRWISSIGLLIAAGDNHAVSLFDHTTGSLIASRIDAHADYVRQIAIHPTKAEFLSCSDDQTINLYSIKSNEIVIMKRYEGHEHYVMDVKFNPADEGVTFASASLDCTIKFWELAIETSQFTLRGHEAGVNCIAFSSDRDKPYLVSGSDDFSIKIWDYRAQSCLETLCGHRGNVTALKFHPILPLLISTAEDETIIVWNALTFKHEKTLDNERGRGWCIDANANFIAIGQDRGLVLLKLESSEIHSGEISSACILVDDDAIPE
jgi:coatomer subunit beta'